MSEIERNDGRLAENVLLFARTLRNAGLPVGTAQVVDALLAIALAGIQRRDDVYWALRSILLKSPAHRKIFDQAFHLYFRNPRFLERVMALLLPAVTDESTQNAAEAAVRRLLDAIHQPLHDDAGETETAADRANSYSGREILRNKDFEQMSLWEQREAEELLRADIDALRERPSRRFRANPIGDRFDLRRSFRRMLRTGGELIPLAKQSPATRPPDVTLICDISGSMSAYSRMFLHFAHALTRRQPVVNTFLFGTRLTSISRQLRFSDVDQAVKRVSDEVADWDGGTRIAQSLGSFNRHWTRRVLARESIVFLLSDGLERDTESDLEVQMARLRRSCRRLIWMNPMLRYAGFEPKATGIRKMLPHVDLFVPAHNVRSLTGLLHVLSGSAVERGFPGSSAVRSSFG